MGTDLQPTQLDQCLSALANANVHWWDAMAITQTQADQLSQQIGIVLGAAVIYSLVAYILKTA